MTEARLVIKVDSTGATAGKKSLDDLAQSGKKAEGATDDLSKSTDRFSNAARTAVGVLASLGVALSAREIIQYSDAWRNAENQLRLVTTNTGELASMQRTLVQLANTTNSEFGATATLYSRLARSTADLGLSQEELIGITRTINQSFAVSGATAGEAEGAIRQLAQGFAAGALRGDEFNSVAENAPGIMDAIAKSLNMTRGELRGFAAEGGITAEIVVQALQGAAETIQSDYDKMSDTFGQSMAKVKNNMTEFVGTNDVLQGSVSAVGNTLVAVSENLDHVAAGIGITALALSAQFAPALVTSTVAATNLRAILTALAGPAGIVGIAAGAMYLLVQRQKETADAAWEQARAFEGVIERLHAMTAQEIQQAIREEERHRLALEKKRDGLQILFDTQGMYKDELRRANMEVSNSVDNQALLERQLARVNAGWKPVTASVDQNTTATERNTAAVLTLDDVYRQAATGSLSLTADAYVRLMGITDQVTTRQTRLSADTQAVTVDMQTLGLAMGDTATASAAAAQISADEWRDFRNSFSDGLADMMMNGGNVFDNIAKSFERMLYKMAGDLIASGIMSFLTGQSGGFSIAGTLANSGATGTITSAAISKFAPGLAKTLGLSGLVGAGGTSSAAAGYVSLMEASGATFGAGAGAAGAGGGLMSGIGALASNPITWAVAGAALIASQLKESTPSHNAGFLLNAVPGAKADQMFNIDPFASGLTPVGFTRRASQQDAMGVIDSFRSVDQQITDIARGAGLAFNITADRLGGLAETGLGQGRFFGSAGEEGKPGMALDTQIDMFARQLIGQLAGQLEGETLNRVLSAGNADAMIRELENAIGMTKESTASITEQAAAIAQQTTAEKDLISSKERLLAQYSTEAQRLEAAKQQIRDTFSEFGVAVPNSTAELRALIETINPLSERGQAAMLALQGLSGAIDLVTSNAGKKANELAAAQSILGSDFATAGTGVTAAVTDRRYEWLHGSHADGLDYVPFNGYRAELHQGERVQTAKQARESDQTAAEVRSMRTAFQKMEIALNTIAVASNKTARALEQAAKQGEGALAVVTV